MTSGEQVAAGVDLVSKAGDALNRINGRIAEVSTLMRQIATTSEQQATGLAQVNTAVSEMDGVTQQNAAMVEEATAAARSLADEAQTLAKEISRFRTSAGGEGVGANPVHQMQDRVAKLAPQGSAGTRVAAPTARAVTHGNTALAEDWTKF